MSVGQAADNRVFRKEVVQARIDVQAGKDSGPDVLAGRRGQASAIRRQSHDEVFGGRPVGAGRLEGLLQAGKNGDSPFFAVQHPAGILAGVAGIDHGKYIVALGKTHQPMRGLSFGGIESALAVNDGIAVQHFF